MEVTSARALSRMERTDSTLVAWWTTVADLCTSNSRKGASASLFPQLVAFSPPLGRRRGRSVQFDYSAAAQPLAVSLLDRSTGDSPPLAPRIGFVLALSACSAPLAVAASTPIAAVRGRPGALGSAGFVDATRLFCRARGLLSATHSY